MTLSSTPTNIMLSLVADTNQFLSGFIYHGMSKVVFDLVLDKKINLYISTVLKNEVLKKLQEFGVNFYTLDEIFQTALNKNCNYLLDSDSLKSWSSFF